MRYLLHHAAEARNTIKAGKITTKALEVRTYFICSDTPLDSTKQISSFTIQQAEFETIPLFLISSI